MSSEENAALTDSANRALETYLALERQKIVERARTVAASRTGENRIDSPDVIASLSSEADDLEQIRWQEMYEYRQIRRKRQLQIANVYGQTLFLCGAFMAIYFQFRDALQTGTAVGLAVAAAGAIISTSFSRVLPLIQPRSVVYHPAQRDTSWILSHNAAQPDSTSELIGRYIETWNELEQVVRMVAQESAPTGGRNTSLRDIVGGLVEREVLTMEDAEVFFTALRLRNRLVHGMDDSVQPAEIKNGMADMEHLKYHLEGLL